LSAAARTAAAVATGAATRPVERWHGARVEQRDDRLAEEVPIAIAYNDIPFAVMMATPADLDDFALGFSLTEGLIESPSELEAIERHARIEGIELKLRVPAARADSIAARSRALEGRSGCGVCGSRSIEDVLRAPPPIATRLTLRAPVLAAGLERMRQAQTLNAATGATHAAAWIGLDGELHALREDVGRHNALDKLVGALVASGYDPAAGFAAVTSRASYEMVLKAAAARIAVLAAVSAPTALAVDLARSAGMTLIGFARDGDCSVYAHRQRFHGAEAP
jgi:FdhD protein